MRLELVRTDLPTKFYNIVEIPGGACYVNGIVDPAGNEMAMNMTQVVKGPLDEFIAKLKEIGYVEV